MPKDPVQRAARRAACATRDAELTRQLIAQHPGWRGQCSLRYEDLGDIHFDLAKLLRCGWHKRDSEESHKFLRYIERHVGESSALVRLRDDVGWDELPGGGVRVTYVQLPEPFGSTTPPMERILGELWAAVIASPAEGHSSDGKQPRSKRAKVPSQD